MSAAIGNWVQMSTSSTGTGTLTLTTKTGYPTIEKLFSGIYNLSTGSFIVQYDIVDTASGTPQFESGVGSYNLATGVLTRSVPQKTFDGTTYDATTPSALNFATAANITVMMSPLAERGFLAKPGVGNTSTYLSGSTAYNMFPSNITGVSGTGAVTAGREYYVPIYWPGGCQITGVSAYLSTKVGTDNCKVAWFDIATDGGFGNKVLPDVTIALTANGAPNSASISNFCPPPGWYYQGCIFDQASTIGKGYILPFSSPMGHENSTLKPIFGFFRTGSYASGVSGLTTSPTTFTPVGQWTAVADTLHCFAYLVAA